MLSHAEAPQGASVFCFWGKEAACPLGRGRFFMRGGRRWRRFLTLSGAYAYFFRFLYKPSIVRSKIEPAIQEQKPLEGNQGGLAVASPQAALEKSMSCSRWKDHPACFVCWWLLSTASGQVVALKCFDCMIWPEGIRWNTIQESAGAVFCWHSR